MSAPEGWTKPTRPLRRKKQQARKSDWTYSPYRATLKYKGKFFSIVFVPGGMDGAKSLSKKAVAQLLEALNE